MRGSFVYHKNTNKKRILKRIVLTAASVVMSVCILSACGPEPGQDGEEGQISAGEMFSGPEAAPGKEDAAGSAGGTESAAEKTDTEKEDAAGPGNTSAGGAGSTAGFGPAGAGTASSASAAASAEQDLFSHPIQGEITQSDPQTLEMLQNYLNEDSSYGFLLSSYDIPEEIDLNQVFYSGAGYEQKELTKKEKELLLQRIPQDEISTPVVKVTDEQVDTLLRQKAGITYDEAKKSFKEEDGWEHIGRMEAWYALRGDSNRMYAQCTDAWQQGDLYIIHYRLTAQPPASSAAKAATDDAAETEAETGETASTAAAATASAETAATVSTAATATASAETADTAAAATEKEETRGTAGATTASAETAATASTAATATASAETADTAAAAAEKEKNKEETLQSSGEVQQENAIYQPVYEVQLQKTGSDYRFCYNIVWTQKDLIESQSYKAELKPVGEVFFAPLYPDTAQNEMADVTFALEQNRAVLAILTPMEENNIRKDRIFTGVDAVDFTDYNEDGFTDILTVCSYTGVSEDGKKDGTIREARVYTGRKDAVPVLDREKTSAVNQNVEVLNITNVIGYLTGKTDGKAKTYSSWKEAFADYISEIDTEEYDGFDLIYLNEDRTPELVLVGATTAKGATIAVYRSGTVEETWLNRRDFQYLEYENLLYSPSGVENLHYDTIYSIAGGRLGVSVQGYYGNSSFARVRFDEQGKASYDYFWEGGQVSESGYRDGISFVFDMSRSKTCEGEQLMTAGELLEKLKN